MRRRLDDDRGLTLLELVIAVAVLSIGTLAALRATDQSRLALAAIESIGVVIGPVASSRMAPRSVRAGSARSQSINAARKSASSITNLR